MEPFEPRYAITFGEVAVLHAGGAEFAAGGAGAGFTVAELRRSCTIRTTPTPTSRSS